MAIVIIILIILIICLPKRLRVRPIPRTRKKSDLNLLMLEHKPAREKVAGELFASQPRINVSDDRVT